MNRTYEQANWSCVVQLCNLQETINNKPKLNDNNNDWPSFESVQFLKDENVMTRMIFKFVLVEAVIATKIFWEVIWKI